MREFAPGLRDSLGVMTFVRWHDGLRCPRCAHKHISRLRNQGKYECAACKYQFSITSGTVMHKTRVPVHVWTMALALLIETRGEASAKSIQRLTWVSYPTAWRMKKLLNSPSRGQALGVPWKEEQ